MKRFFLNALIMFIACAILSCSKPIPAEKSSYIGEWQSAIMGILITQDDKVSYKLIENGITKSVEGPIKAFDGDNFEVGIGPFTTIFVVTVPPHQQDNDWKMTVDGVDLTKNP